MEEQVVVCSLIGKEIAYGCTSHILSPNDIPAMWQHVYLPVVFNDVITVRPIVSHYDFISEYVVGFIFLVQLSLQGCDQTLAFAVIAWYQDRYAFCHFVMKTASCCIALALCDILFFISRPSSANDLS